MIKKIKKCLLENYNIILTVVTGVIIISIIYALQQVSPFGKHSLLAIDFYHQYAPMLGELFDRVKNGSNLIYSFTTGFGLPFFKNYLNYMSSPFNIIIFLFKRENLLMSFSIIIGLKAVASAATMIYYINNKLNTKSLWFVPLGLLYGFCAYFGAYYWNIMWLDGLVFLPLIVLGIERVVNDNKCALYIISLATMLIANYFIAFMICIFSVIYFCVYLFIKADKPDIKNLFNKFLLFGGSSLLSGGISAVFLLPLFLGINTISATADLWPNSQYYAFNFGEFLANHFSGVKSTVLASGVSNAPNISVGILSIALFFLFIFNKEIKPKIKIGYMILITILIVSFFGAPLDFIWHAFHVPNDLPYRYSFIYSFILITISAYSLYKIKSIKVSVASIVYTSLMVSITILYFFKYDNIDNSIIILNYLILTLYYIVYLLNYYYPKVSKKLPYLFILVIILEVTISINSNWSIDQDLKQFYSDYSQSKEDISFIDKNEKDKIYRIENTNTKTFNDPAWYGYKGQMIFSSMAYESMAILQNNLGMPGNNINSYYYKQNTPIYDLMFNIKYIIGDTLDISRYNLFYNENGKLIFKSDFESSLIYAVNSNIKNWKFDNENPFSIQNDFLHKATGIKDVLKNQNILEKELLYNSENKIYKYTTSDTNDNMYYYINNDVDFIIINDTLYYHNEDYKYADKLGDQVNIFDFKDLNENYMIVSRTDNETYDFYIGHNSTRENSFYAYTIDNEKFNQAAAILKENSATVTKFKENNIAADIKLKESKTIYTSIPFDKGWKVYDNGNKLETFAIGNSFLAFDLNSGEHNLNIKYIPYGIYVGTLISTFSILMVSIIYITKNKKIFY